MLFSIITPSLNQRAFFGATARSVLSQDGNFELEWLIIDGGSTDGTLELLRGLSDPRVRFISEPDRGQAHAINKGLAMARGEVVAWLNGDDLYTTGALAAVAEAFRQDPAAQWLAGECQIIDSAGRIVRPSVTGYKGRFLRRYRYRALLRENFISQPAVFWRRDFGQSIGPVDESLHWTMDYDLWLRMGARGDPLVLDRTLAQFRVHDRSKSGRLDRRQFDEQYQVAQRYLANDRLGRFIHRCNVEKIVWAYRMLRLLGK